MKMTPFLRKGDYLEIEFNGLKEAYVVTGYDIISTPGVEFVSVDPQYVRDLTPSPEYNEETDNKEDFYWLSGGDS